jgi:hypothetical protein
MEIQPILALAEWITESISPESICKTIGHRLKDSGPWPMVLRPNPASQVAR